MTNRLRTKFIQYDTHGNLYCYKCKNTSQKQNLTQTMISAIGLETLKIKDVKNVKNYNI